MKKFVCSICGYVHEGDSAPDFCPVCKQPADKFKEQASDEALVWADEHRVGVIACVIGLLEFEVIGVCLFAFVGGNVRLHVNRSNEAKRQ